MAEKNYRIKANIGQDTVIKASLSQDIDFLEILSLKINQEDTYKLHVSNYGIIVGRVLANEAFGIPNAKVSVFLKLSEEDRQNREIEKLYPYVTMHTKDDSNRRYNLLPNSSDDECYRIVGTFPNKRMVLDNDTIIEVYEKYWKYTTVTNQAGDFMIFGVPTGNQNIHVDIDLSDIGILSQKPRDFYYQGYNQELFESSEQFKKSDNLDSLAQLLSQDTAVYVHPFFGESELDEIAITRCDVQVAYKFEPTCVFMGSIITERKGSSIGHSCAASRKIGDNESLVTGDGTIEMIRQTLDGLVEEFPIRGNKLIDGDGVWCYQIPMNLDYIGTDEFGNIIPVQDSTKGIPTRTSVRFRISKSVPEGEASKEHFAKYLVPNIHELNPTSIRPQIMKGNTYNNCYEFGSATPKEFFRDLLWNKVYSVKNYIPRFQTSRRDKTRSYGGIRSVNKCTTKNIFPYNNAFVRLRFSYVLLCTIMQITIFIISQYNLLISNILCFCLKIKPVLKIDWSKFKFSLTMECVYPFQILTYLIKCIGIEGEKLLDPESNVEYFPNCNASCGQIRNCKSNGCEINTDTNLLVDVVQQTLAEEYDVVNFDFANDWVNGTLYMPLWFWLKKAKKKYFFGLFTAKAKNKFCSCDKKYNSVERKKLRVREFCSINYNRDFSPNNVDATRYVYDTDTSLFAVGFDGLYGNRNVIYGMIKEFTNRQNLNIYYYAPGVPHDESYATKSIPVDYTYLFATDIILLGSLNSCDLDNLPQAFNSLPSTTAHVPFITTLDSEEDGGVTVTGLDWGHDGDSKKRDIRFDNGLLFDLTCWQVFTLYKSCVNLQRLCELGVREDMDDIKEDKEDGIDIKHDGMITQKEIMDNNTRAIFASLNHNGLTNIRKNVTTNYDTYKFHYIYPTNFDGHLAHIAPTYSSKYKLNDISDKNYVMYRLGEGKDSPYGRHVKHFYNFNEKNNLVSFPLYNNSFYFYFGLNEGRTAIDKFHTLFRSSCALENKFSFTIEATVKPAKWCYNVDNVATDFATIDIEFNGLTPIFSYTLYNEFDEVLIQEKDVKSEDLRFGYKVIENGGSYIVSSNEYKKDGRLQYFNSGEYVKNSFDDYVYLVNGIYYLEIVNSNGVKNTQRISVQQNTLSPILEEFALGTKYRQNDSANTICNEKDVYGELHVKGFIIDGKEVTITNFTPLFVDGDENNRNLYEVTCQVECSDGSILYLILEPDGSETTPIIDFICNNVNNISSIIEDKDENDNITLIFNIWKPGDYVLTTTQICNNVMNDNVSVNTFSIENGDKFQGFINGVSLNVLNGTSFSENSKQSGLINNCLNAINIPIAWLNLFNPEVYNFADTTVSGGSAFWDEILDITISNGSEIDESGNTREWKYVSEESKISILQYQIETMQKMINSSYITSENGNENKFIFTTKGGKEPILIRNIHPNYVEFENNDKSQHIIIDDTNIVEAWVSEPNVINYSEDYFEEDNFLNKNFIDYKKQGNYFAAFTNNGGMVQFLNGCGFDASIITESIPQNVKQLKQYCPNSKYLPQIYPSEVYNENNPYFKTLFIDAKIKIFVPKLWLPLNTSLKLDDNVDSKYGNLNIELCGVLPMIYDENYNIIGKDLMYDIENNEYESVENINELKEDKAIKLVRKYNWNDNGLTNGVNKGKIYRLSVLSDNLETDLRENMKVFTNETNLFGGKIENGDIIHNGQKITLSVGNNKLKGNLDNNTFANKINFVSHVIEDAIYDFEFDNSNRINATSGNFIFSSNGLISNSQTSNLKWYYYNNQRLECNDTQLEIIDDTLYEYSNLSASTGKISYNVTIDKLVYSFSGSNFTDGSGITVTNGENKLDGTVELNVFDKKWYFYDGNKYYPMVLNGFFVKINNDEYRITSADTSIIRNYIKCPINNYHKTTINLNVKNSEKIVVGEKEFTLNNDLNKYLSYFSFKKVTDFKCTVKNDNVHTFYDNIRVYAPKLFVGYSEYFGFNKILSATTQLDDVPLYNISGTTSIIDDIFDITDDNKWVYDNIITKSGEYYFYNINGEIIGGKFYCKGNLNKNNYLREFHDSSQYMYESICNKDNYPFEGKEDEYFKSGLISILKPKDNIQYSGTSRYVNNVYEEQIHYFENNEENKIIYTEIYENDIDGDSFYYEMDKNSSSKEMSFAKPSVIVGGITRQYGDNNEFTIYNHNSMWDTKDVIFKASEANNVALIMEICYNDSNYNNDIIDGLINQTVTISWTGGTEEGYGDGQFLSSSLSFDFIVCSCEDGYELILHKDDNISFIDDKGIEYTKNVKELNQFDKGKKIPHFINIQEEDDSQLLSYSILYNWKNVTECRFQLNDFNANNESFTLLLNVKGVNYNFKFKKINNYYIGINNENTTEQTEE